MWNFQDTFETRKRSFISTFSICMTVPLNCFSREFAEKLFYIKIDFDKSKLALNPQK